MPELQVQSIAQTKRATLAMLTLYMIGFYLVWIFKAIYLNPLFESWFLPTHPLLHSLVSDGSKLLIWIIPALLIVHCCIGENALTYLKLNTNIRPGLAWGFISGLLYVSLLLVIAYFRGGPLFHWHQSLSNWIGGIILVGLVEEIPFRGLLLQTLMRQMPFLHANLIVSVLFLLIHFPGWYAHHYGMTFFLINGFGVFIRALVFAWLAKRTDSLWAPIVFHMLNNFGHMVILP